MATSTKKNFSNFGLLEKQARRYSILWKRFSKRCDNGTLEIDPNEERELSERGAIRHQIVKLIGHALAHDFFDTLEEDSSDHLFLDWTAYRTFEFPLGILTGLGFKKIRVVVRDEYLDEVEWKAKLNGWELTASIERTALGFEAHNLTFVNTNQIKD